MVRVADLHDAHGGAPWGASGGWSGLPYSRLPPNIVIKASLQGSGPAGAPVWRNHGLPGHGAGVVTGAGVLLAAVPGAEGPQMDLPGRMG
ncbi:hypothetical protein DVDV_1689 [Desulfovibrio sp. DV]|nr:hypothetical protein DVDV_1689 [Desulfovibrio sp. DV]